MSEKSCVSAVASDVLQVALTLMGEVIALANGRDSGGSLSLPVVGDNLAENVLYVISCYPDVMVRSPSFVFKHRSRRGDFNELGCCINPDETPDVLSDWRIPMDCDMFAKEKQNACQLARLWNFKYEASLSTLWAAAMSEAQLYLNSANFVMGDVKLPYASKACMFVERI